MTQQFGKHAFDQAGKLFKDAVVQKNFQALSENAVAASKGFYDQVTAAGLEQTKVLTDIADTAWDSTKMLNEKVAQNVISSIEAIFAGAQLMAGAKSLPEIAKLQREFVQNFAAQSMQQTTELFDLSTRASQHVLEKVQDDGKDKAAQSLEQRGGKARAKALSPKSSSLQWPGSMSWRPPAHSVSPSCKPPATSAGGQGVDRPFTRTQLARPQYAR